jgi:hypothetical protein
MRGVTIGVVLVILVVATFGSAYLLRGNQETATSASTRISTITSTQTSVFSSTTQASTSSPTLTETSSNSTSVTSITSSVGTGQPIEAADVEAANVTLENMDGGGHYAAFDANGTRIYALGVPLWVDDSRDYSLAVVDTSSNTVVANVSLPHTAGLGYCYNLAFDDSTGMVYVIVVGASNDALLGEMVAFNASTDAITAEVPLQFGFLATYGFSCDLGVAQYDPSTAIMWGPTIGGDGSDAVAGVNVLTGSVVESVRLSFAPGAVAVDPYTNTVYAYGCTTVTVCDPLHLAIINGTSGSLAAMVSLNSSINATMASDYGRMVLDPSTDVVYVSEGSQLVALNGTNGNVIFNVYPETCGPSTIAVIPSLDQVVMFPSNHPSYLLVYDGATGALVNMYSFASNGQQRFAGFGVSVGVAYDVNTAELYFFAGADTLVALHYDVQTIGNVNATLVDTGCVSP